MIEEYTTGSEKPDEGGIIGLFLGGAPSQHLYYNCPIVSVEAWS